MNPELHGKSAESSHCPSVETISAFFDKELDSASADFAHIAACPKCQRRLASYKALDMSLKKGFPVPAELPENVRKGVRKKLELEKRRSEGNILFPFLRVAALFVVGFVAFWVLGRGLFDKKDSGRLLEPPVNPSALAKKTKAPDQQKIVSTGSLELDSLMNVSFGGPQGISLPEESSKKKPVDIATQVLHVWTTKDPGSAEAKFKAIAARLGVEGDALKSNREGDHLKFFCQINKEQLVRLVRLCSSNGFELFSPEAPQPEQKEFMGRPSDHVQYIADIVLSGK